MIQVLAAYAVTFVAFASVDSVWANRVMHPIFQRDLPYLLAQEPSRGRAMLFGAVYCAAVVYLAVAPALATGSVGAAARDGMLLGLVVYGAFQIVRMIAGGGVHWRVFVTSLVWGVFLSGVSAAIGVYAVS